MSNALQTLVKQLPGTSLLPDNNTHQNRIEIPNSSGERFYVVAQAKATGEWQCSCPGWVMKKAGKERTCKHMKAMLPALQSIESQIRKALK
jgi:hypothetical protein